MALHDLSDKSIYQQYKIVTNKISHGRITLENWDKVITLKGRCWMEWEVNEPSPRDPMPKISIIIKGGDWSIDEKKSNTVKNCAAFRYNQLSLGLVKNES